MRKIVVLEFISLDGVIQAPGGPEEDRSGGFEFGGWIVPFSDEVIGEAMKERMFRPFDLLLGRKTFDIWAPYWPAHSEQWPGVMTATKNVVSNTITEHPWQKSVFLGGDVVTQIKNLKAEDGPELQVYGSSGLVQTLLQNDLVDELLLKIYPVTLGKGKRLFGDGTMPKSFVLSEGKVSPSGVLVASYSKGGEVKTGSF